MIRDIMTTDAIDNIIELGLVTDYLNEINDEIEHISRTAYDDDRDSWNRYSELKEDKKKIQERIKLSRLKLYRI